MKYEPRDSFEKERGKGERGKGGNMFGLKEDILKKFRKKLSENDDEWRALINKAKQIQ